MLCKTAAVLTALLSLTALWATGADAGFPNENEPGKVLLFSFDAHSGKDALAEFRRRASHDVIHEQGIVFRSSLLNNVPEAVKMVNAWEIVVEMRKGDNEVVASATFDVTRDTGKLNSENWFTQHRLVKSYPYWIGKGHYEKFSIAGHSWGSFRRSFYIQFTHKGCPHDTGFMGIGNSASDGCQWVKNGIKGNPPVLFYSDQKNVPYARNVKYADRLVIYLKSSPMPYIFEPGKVLLYTIKANSGQMPLDSYRNSNADDSVPQRIPSVYRSSLLDNMPRAIEDIGGGQIVAEMRKNGQVVASATFDVTQKSESVNSENWFSPERLVDTYPFQINKHRRFEIFSIAGHSWGSFRRSFYIQFTHKGCPHDTGFMGVGNSASDGCQWVKNGIKGNPPVLWYSDKKNVPYAKSVKYADRLVVYMLGRIQPFMIGPGNALLFTITANSGKDALTEFRNTKADDSHPHGEGIPSLFRSSLLNDIPDAVKMYQFTRIVVEMRKGDNEVVASATFDVTRDTEKLNSENWFTQHRLVKSYPYWIGKGHYEKFSIAGHSWGSFRRSFYIQFTHKGCPHDTGFMGIGNSASDGCQWVKNGIKGKPPVLFYSDQKKVPYARNVKYADRFVIYFE